MKIDRAQPRRAGAGYVRRRLENIELCPEARAQVSFRDLERFIRILHVPRFGLENPVRLLEIEKGAANVRCDRELRRFQSVQCSIAARARGLEPAAGRKAIENMPGGVHSDDKSMIELRSHGWISLAIKFV